MSNFIRLITFSVEVTPTLSLAGYAKNDRIGSIQELFIKDESTDFVDLINLQIVDLTGQGPAMDIFFFSTNPTSIAADNAPFSLNNADALQYHGSIAVVTLDWFFSASQAFASVPTQIPMKLSPEHKIFAVAKINENATFSANSLKFRYYFSMDYSGQ